MQLTNYRDLSIGEVVKQLYITQKINEINST
jgi:hypothetical protein